MMFPGWGMGGWMMISYGLVVLLILVGIVVALVALSRRTGRNGPTATPTANELLAQRYARDEIDDDEYFQRLSVLDSSREPAPPDRWTSIRLLHRLTANACCKRLHGLSCFRSSFGNPGWSHRGELAARG
jgi:putative membrane protein